MIDAFQVQLTAAKESGRNKAHCWFSWAAVISNDWEMQSVDWLIDWLTSRITNGLIGWSCSKVNFTWKQPSSQSVKLQRGGSFIWNTRESGFHFRGGNHLVVTQKPHVSFRMWEHEHVIQKPIILKAMVSIKNETHFIHTHGLISWKTKRETGHSFLYNDREWGFYCPAPNTSDFQRINTYYIYKYLTLNKCSSIHA